MTATSQLDREFIETRLFPLSDTLRDGEVADRRLSGLALYSLFYEPSLLTRTSFERAMGLLGGQVYHTEDASQFYPVSNASHIDNVINILASLRIDVVVLRSSAPGVVERAEFADTLAVINGGSADDHPTQALADLYTLKRELGGIDGVHVAVVGRLEHRNVNALLRGLALFENIRVTLIPVSGGVDPDVLNHCRQQGMRIDTESDIGAAKGGRHLPERSSHPGACAASALQGRVQPADRQGLHGEPQAALHHNGPDAAQRRLRGRGRRR